MISLKADYIESIEIFNQKMLLGNVIDNIFSNVTGNLNLSLEQITNEQKTNKLIDKILDTDPCLETMLCLMILFFLLVMKTLKRLKEGLEKEKVV